MKVKAEPIPFSSVVGTGVSIKTEKGKQLFLMNMLAFSEEVFGGVERVGTAVTHDEVKRKLQALAQAVADVLDGAELPIGDEQQPLKSGLTHG